MKLYLEKNRMVEEIKNAFRASLEDQVLVGSEKKDLKQLITNTHLDRREKDLLRSEIFKMAKSKILDSNSEFILDWLEEANKLLLDSKSENAISAEVYFSPGEECLNAILNQIKLSHSKIEICLFTISDNRISEALEYKHKQGVSVKIITDNDKIFDKGSDIEQLAGEGIPIKVDITDNHMHHKFAIFDSKRILTGSYNWTRSAEKYNHENIIITDNLEILKEFKKEFSNLWEELVSYGEI